jgi:hypothetical protein
MRIIFQQSSITAFGDDKPEKLGVFERPPDNGTPGMTEMGSQRRCEDIFQKTRWAIGVVI